MKAKEWIAEAEGVVSIKVDMRGSHNCDLVFTKEVFIIGRSEIRIAYLKGFNGCD